MPDFGATVRRLCEFCFSVHFEPFVQITETKIASDGTYRFQDEGFFRSGGRRGAGAVYNGKNWNPDLKAPLTLFGGYTNFTLYFYAQVGKEAVIVDEGFNGARISLARGPFPAIFEWRSRLAGT